MSRYAQFSVKDVGDQALSSVDIAAVLGIVEYTEHPFAKGALTTNGVQYCTEVLAATGTTNQTIESVTIDPDADGDVIEYEFGLTAAFKATSMTTADIIYQWQAKNATSSTWVNLHAAATITDASTLYVATGEPTQSGRYAAEANLNRVPFDLRCIFQCNTSTEAYGKTKNSCYTKVIYKAD